MNVLITGGAGYIGSHMVRMLHGQGVKVSVLDTLEFGHKESLPKDVVLHVGSVGDERVLQKVFESTQVDAVIHFAAYISVAESVHEPIKYMKNNLLAPVALLETMGKHKVKKLIFSSTAAVYGNPTTVPIPETHLKNPTSPYGLSKWSFEELLRVYDYSHAISSISLRYFNASGASLDGAYGEAHTPETHIIPRAISAAQNGEKFMLYGTSYPTRDGSCERDYIHVEDLCRAHVVCLDALFHGHKTDQYNVGTGKGVTNREVIDAVSGIVGQKIIVEESGNRPGDPAILVADSLRLRTELGWKPEHSDIQTIVQSAYAWHKKHPNGYL